MKKVFLAILLSLSLAACTSLSGLESGVKADVQAVAADLTGGKAPLQAVEQKVAGTTVDSLAINDLKAAIASANEAGDAVGASCWQALLDIVSGPETVGIASGIQKSRNIMAKNIPMRCSGILNIQQLMSAGAVSGIIP